MPEPMFVVNDLAIRFGAAHVIDSLSFSVDHGEVVGLVGPNGAGKTSTLRAISGVIARTAGDLTLEGTSLPRRPDAVAALGVAHVPEGRGLIPSLTVRQNVELGAAALGRKVRGPQWEQVLGLFPAIEPFLSTRAGLLSGGQQQMVAVARGLVSDARLIMVDELSLGLAPAVVTDLLEALRSIADSTGAGLLLVDQNVRALAEICDRSHTIRDGRGYDVDLEQLDVMHSDYLGSRRTS
ncbi:MULTISPECIES: ABC transporter ATP-binding protein [unclassified Aeromicrobium]|uniref:ABC transporter ATP-binding protein n=1 Tax=unclassified Aeromicrobium TaxID=2633570 RepID=UPI00396B20B0